MRCSAAGLGAGLAARALQPARVSVLQEMHREKLPVADYQPSVAK
ncbi:MAG: hypothetical protein ACRD01_08790 [Terriglobales bacterium]